MLVRSFDETGCVAIALRFTLRYPAGSFRAGFFLAAGIHTRASPTPASCPIDFALAAGLPSFSRAFVAVTMVEEDGDQPRRSVRSPRML